MKNFKIPILLALGVLVWTCEDEVPIMGIHHHELDEPDSNPTITESNYTDGTDFSKGYYNGKIRSDQVNLAWNTSEDENFLAYKIFRATGYEPEDDGNGVSSVTFTKEDYANWSSAENQDRITDNVWITRANNQGLFNAAQQSGYSSSGPYGTEWAVGSFEDIESLYFQGFYYCLGGNIGSQLNGWIIPSNQPMVLHLTEEDIYYEVQFHSWTQGNDGGGFSYTRTTGQGVTVLSYELVKTLNDQNITTFLDTALSQNQYYTYKVANIVKTGTHKVDDIAIKTPKWQAPDSVIANGLSPRVVELNWKDNTESETAFKIYIDTMDVYLWDYVMVDSTTAGQNDTTKVITGLSETAQYRFSIKAKNSWENDTPLGYSSSFEFQFNPPSNLLASQTSGAKAVSLTWYDNSTLESGFIIERDTTGNDFETLATVASNITSYTDTDTTNFEYGNEITYRVRAYNDYSGTVYSEYSNEASITISDVIEVFVQFTNCGQTGRYGPSQGQCNSEYGPGEVIVNDGIQEWTVPYTGIYTIEVWGARGGDAYGYSNSNYGKGARMKGDFQLTSGEILKVLVGQIGQDAYYGGGGAGGTFISQYDNNPLIIAGGGAGEQQNSNYDGAHASTSENGNNSDGGWPGGTDGSGGGGYGNNAASGGGGLYGDGQDGYSSSSPGLAFINGGAGGDNCSSDAGEGGFGGGGGSEWCNYGSTGGGGGYSGGAGGYSVGGGGGSYNAGTNQDNENGVNEGHGYVIIRNF